MDPKPEKAEAEGPPPIKPDNVLDSIFSKDGPMPMATFRLRALAFLLDFILITAIASLIVWKIALPQMHPGSQRDLKQWSKDYTSWYAEQTGQNLGDTQPLEQAVFLTSAAFFRQIPPIGPESGRELNEALATSYDIRLLIFWLYFAIGEAFFAGSSLGKRICRIRSVSLITLGTPPIISGIVRGGMKTITLFWIFPLTFIATFATLFFNKRRQLGHDLFSRTTVVDEKYVNLAKRA